MRITAGGVSSKLEKLGIKPDEGVRQLSKKNSTPSNNNDAAFGPVIPFLLLLFNTKYGSFKD